MTRFEVFSALANPGLHVWRPGTNLEVFLRRDEAASSLGRAVFQCELGAAPLEEIRCQIFEWGADSKDKRNFEQDAHIKVVPRLAANALPPVVYLWHGAARAVATDPTAVALDSVRIHLITASKYKAARLYRWGANLPADGDFLDQTGHTDEGPFWDVPLTGASRSFFLFKFFRPVDSKWIAEGDYANRVYIASDGPILWTHSETRDVLAAQPVLQGLTVRFRQELPATDPPVLHVWQEGSDFSADLPVADTNDGWTRHDAKLYTGLHYRIQFLNPTLPEATRWEHDDCKRDVKIAGPEERWTLEGAPEWFTAEPKRDSQVDIEVSAQQPGFEVAPPFTVEARVNRARAPFVTGSGLSFRTYPNVATSFRIAGSDRVEPIDRHYLRAVHGATRKVFVVTGRPPVLDSAAPADLFQDPPFSIKRPGAYEESGNLRFNLHAPWCALAELELDGSGRTPMKCTKDGTYWWTQMPAPAGYHGHRYRFVLNGDTRVQDPAAGWVESSKPEGWSKLVRRAEYKWGSDGWKTPSWDYLSLYQVHPNRFSGRSTAATAFDRVADELTSPTGYLRKLRFTALQLMPVNEVGTINSWGYDPAFYYAVEIDYGGPDALKRLVDACHRNGITVLVDVIFNHAGTTDNILWTTAQGTFFDGDTDWGAMINYSEPRVIHFFEQNVIYLLEEYRVDGIRFDFTRVIVHGGEAGEAHIRKPGHGGGWEFLHRIRNAMHSVNPNSILIAEHLPNEWAVTNFGGPMDTQWCDDFHDRLKDACAGSGFALPGLATAMKLTHTDCDNWYKATNYAESHDEVGNENGRIANVGGFGRGLRRAKVASCVTLLSRGVPMHFMGAEAGEFKQFMQGSAETLDLDSYETGERARLVAWTNALLNLRRGNSAIQGPSPLAVVYAQDEKLAWSRGEGGDYFILVNFGGWTGWSSLAELNLPEHRYRELWNSTWPAFQVESEDEHTNGGRDARLDRGSWLQIPDYGAVILERA